MARVRVTIRRRATFRVRTSVRRRVTVRYPLTSSHPNPYFAEPEEDPPLLEADEEASLMEPYTEDDGESSEDSIRDADSSGDE